MILIGMEQHVLHRAVAMEIVVENHVRFLNRAEVAHHKGPVVIRAVERTPEAVCFVSLRGFGEILLELTSALKILTFQVFSLPWERHLDPQRQVHGRSLPLAGTWPWASSVYRVLASYCCNSHTSRSLRLPLLPRLSMGSSMMPEIPLVVC